MSGEEGDTGVIASRVAEIRVAESLEENGMKILKKKGACRKIKVDKEEQIKAIKSNNSIGS